MRAPKTTVDYRCLACYAPPWRCFTRDKVHERTPTVLDARIPRLPGHIRVAPIGFLRR